jgi:ubiquinone/menaquinone biosynthesis C-methylase UbiE
LLAGGREWIGARATGRVLEVAIGTGRSLPFYRSGATVVGLDLAPAMLDIAGRRAAQLGVPVELIEGDAERLPFEDSSFDTVVCALALCSIPRPEVAVAEMRRVLVPGGTLLLLDHVASSHPLVRAAQWLVERVTIATAGEHLTRRQLPIVEGARFTVLERERLKLGIVERIRATRAPESGS